MLARLYPLRAPLALAVLVVSLLASACSSGGAEALVDEGDPPPEEPDPDPDPDPDPTPEDALEYGMNPSFQNWSGRAIVFADAMARASEFVVVRGGNLTPELAPAIPLGGQPQALGAGWPDLASLPTGDLAGAFLFSAMEGSIPDGRVEPFVLTWEGTGDCRLIGTAVLGEGARSPGRVEYFVDPTAEGGNGNVAWVCQSSDPLDPVRDVHVWLPGTADEQPLFWPPYVERLRAMNGGRGPHALRTLEWNRINSYGATDANAAFVFDFAGRIRPGSPSQGTRRGMCPEFQVALCNELGADLHFQLPHRAGISPADYDAFIVDVLRRIRFGSGAVAGLNGGRPFAGLDPTLTLTLELSNEIWNSASPSNAWFQDEARARGMTIHELIALELQHVWTLADSVFVGAGTPTVRRFVGGFIANAGFVQAILDELPAGTRVDALGPAAYFSPPQATVDAWLAGAAGESCPSCPTPAEVVLAARETIAQVRTALQAHRAVADAWTNPDGSSPRLELYEAGQSFLAGSSPWRGAAQAAQLDPELYYAYVDDLIPAFVDAGVDLVHWYSFITEQAPDTGVSVGFGIWNDMNQTITLPVIEPYLDEGAPKAAAIYRGPPARQ